MMNDMEEPDSSVVAVKPTNEGVPVSAESVEQRAGYEGNPGSHSTRRTQGRGSVSQAADRIRRLQGVQAINCFKYRRACYYNRTWIQNRGLGR